MLQTPGGESAVAIVGAGIGIEHPFVGAIIGAFNGITNAIDAFKINHLLKGLDTRLNQETQINQLYSYVSKDTNKAFYVANTLRKALLMESPIAITLLGVILSEHVASGDDYTQADLIIGRALDVATDFDLRQFREIMQKYVPDGSKEEQEIQILKEEMNASVKSTCEWCVYHRIFTKDILKWNENEAIEFNDDYSTTSVSFALMNYMKRINQVFCYK